MSLSAELYEQKKYADMLKLRTMNVNDDQMVECFSKGGRAYYMKPELLKQKDRTLYDFIGGLSND